MTQKQEKTHIEQVKMLSHCQVAEIPLIKN